MKRPTFRAVRRLASADRGLASSEYVVLFVLLVALSVAVYNVFGNAIACKLAGAVGQIADALSVSSASASTIDQCAEHAGASAGEAAARGEQAGASGEQAGASAGEASPRESSDDRSPDRGGGKGKGQKPLPTPSQWAKSMQTVLCPDDKAFLEQLKRDGVTLSLHDDIYFADVEYDGKRWRQKKFTAAGSTDGSKHIYVMRTNNAVEDAATLMHEGYHTQQPASMNPDDVEPDAYLFEEQWRAKKGFPPHDPSFRLPGDAGASVQEMRDYVDDSYPGKVPGSPPGAAEWVRSRNTDGTVNVERANGTVYKRKPKQGDSIPGPQVNKPKKGYPVDLAKLQCP